MSNIDLNRLKHLEGDALICQVGIVDAVRRALRKREERVLAILPIVGKYSHVLAKKYHYTATKIRDIHYCRLPVFKNKMSEICKLIKGEVFFIEIAPPGRAIIEQTYHAAEDINAYNKAITSLQNERVHVIRPYSDAKIDDPNRYLLEDGHHLNLLGEELVFRSVKKVIRRLLVNMYIEKNEVEDFQ